MTEIPVTFPDLVLIFLGGGVCGMSIGFAWAWWAKSP